MFRSRLVRLFAVATLSLPAAVTADGGAFELFVTSENHVFQLDGEGHQGVFATTPADHWPLALAFDRDGTLYVSVTGTGDIRKFGRSGEDLGLFTTVGGTAPFADLVFDAAGNLYGSRFSNNEIWRFAPDGTGVVFAATADGPVGLSFSHDAHLFVALLNAVGGAQNGAIAEYSSDGVLLNSFRVWDPVDVVFENGMLWVTSGATRDIRRYSTGGDLVDVFASGFTEPQQLTFDDAGFVYLTDTTAQVIRRLSPTGEDLGALFPPLYFPYGLAFRPAEIEVLVDVKPGSCRNPLNIRASGVLPVAIVGSARIDVSRIDLSSLKLAGVAPLRAAVDDAVTPAEGGTCGADVPDGWSDLVLHFRTADLVANLGGSLVDGAERRVVLTGRLKPQYGGAGIRGSDAVVLIAK